VLIDLGRAHHLGRRPAVSDRDGPLDLARHGGVVGDDDHRRAQVGVRRSECCEHLLAGCRVEFTRRLIGEQHFGGVRQGNGNRDALLLAARELSGSPLRLLREPESVEQFHGSVGAPVGGGADERHRQGHVLRRAEIGQEVAPGLLPDESDNVAAVVQAVAGRHRLQVPFGDPRAPGGLHVEPGQHIQQRGLSGSRCSDDRDHLAAVDEEVETLQRLNLDLLDLIDAHQVVAHDERVRAVFAFARAHGRCWGSHAVSPTLSTSLSRSRR